MTWSATRMTRATDQDFVQNSRAAVGSRKDPRGLPVGIRSDTMTDDAWSDRMASYSSWFSTGECALLDDSRSGPTVVRFCRETLGIIDSGSHQERSQPFRTAPQGVFVDTRQALRAIRTP